MAPAGAGDPAHGQIVSARCAACHGVKGVTDDPMIPKLAGQNGMYLFMQLKNFKDGQRGNGLMTPVAQALSVEDMDAATIFFAMINPEQTKAAQQPATSQQTAAKQGSNH